MGFLTAADNLFETEEEAIAYADTFVPPRDVTQKSYTCSEDVSIQYIYYEVGNDIIAPCNVLFEEFLAAFNPPVAFPRNLAFRTVDDLNYFFANDPFFADIRAEGLNPASFYQYALFIFSCPLGDLGNRSYYRII